MSSNIEVIILIVLGILAGFLLGYRIYIYVEYKKIEKVIKINSLTFYKAFSTFKITTTKKSNLRCICFLSVCR